MHGSTHRAASKGSHDGAAGSDGAIVAALATCGLVGVVAVMALVVQEVTLLMQTQPGPW
jgi:hypothetical protein